MLNIFRNIFTVNGTSHPLVLKRTKADPKDLLFISDLDGTLLNSYGEISQESIDRLNRLIDKGMKFTIATARNYESVYPILQGLNLQIPVILFNGVYLTEFHTGRNVFLTEFITREVISHMMQLAAPQGIDPFIYTYNGDNVQENHRVYYRNTANDGAKAYIQSMKGERRLTKTEDFRISKDEKVSGFLLIEKKKTLKPIYQELKRRFSDCINLYFAQDVSVKGYHWLQAFHQQATKGRMVKILAQYMKHPLNNVVVFGDFMNDMTMFKIAGHSVAVSNAVPEIKDIAHEVIGSNDSGAVIEFLESLGFDGNP